METDAIRLAPTAARFVTDLYQQGLGEFAYANKLPHILDLVPDVAADEGTDPAAPYRPRDPQRPLVPLGGGKDSVVSVEALRRAGLAPVLFRSNPNALITTMVAAAGLPALVVRRRLDPQLFAMNQAGGYNGHVPVTAINSLLAVATAILHGLGPVVMSNERSASVPNTVWNGREINHQWSKSLAAEVALAGSLADHAGVQDHCFSLLRPFAELHIARMYATTTRYDSVMTSCNRAFLISGGTERWCGECPKCRFVYLALAPFMERERLVRIFGRDLLGEPAQIPGYLELCGLERFKPFECVGEVEESLVAVELLADREQWRDSPVLAAVAAAVPAGGWPSAEQRRLMFTPQGYGLVPPEYRAIVGQLAATGE